MTSSTNRPYSRHMIQPSTILVENIHQRPETKLLRAIFLDRDGTVNVEKGHIIDPAEIELIPHVPQALQVFRQMGFLIVIVSNQSAIGRGLMTVEKFEKVNETLWQLLKNSNACYDAFYFCPHTPKDRCECRKPAPGLILQAASDLNINLVSSYFIGDKITDIEAGCKAGCKTILVLTGEEETLEKIEDIGMSFNPNAIRKNLEQALAWIIDKEHS